MTGPTQEHPRAVTTRAARGDRRHTDRSVCDFTCACTPITLNRRGHFYHAKVRDLSCTGIGLLVNRPIEPGSFLAIRLDDRGGLPLCAKVVHCTLRSDELGWVVGCTLTRQLTLDELDALV